MGVPFGTDEYVLEQALEVVRGGAANRLAHCLANTVALIAIEPLRQRESYLERALGTGFSLEACKMADNGTQWAYEESSIYLEQRRHSHFFRRGARGIS